MSLDDKEVGRQHEVIGNNVLDTAVCRTTHPDAQWFGNAGLGLFLHWGISSVRGEGDISWSMIRPPPGAVQKCLEKHGPQGPGKVFTPADYWAQAERFTADRYDPDKWLAAARCSGFKYAVLTTKHHDGFALWPSAYGEFSTRNYLGGRDLVGEYVTPCRSNGLKVGLYFSMPDWYWSRRLMSFHYETIDHFRKRTCETDKTYLGLRHEPVVLPFMPDDEYREWTAGFREFCKDQIEELLTRYGKIDLFWFDGSEPDAITKERIHELQPGIVVNDRMGFGDYITPEGVFPKKKPQGWWEECHVWNEGGWGYRSHEIYKPTGWVTAELARIRAWGGNFLLNMAPDSHGELPPVAYRRLDELAAWMRHSRESIENTTLGSWPERCNVPVTCRDNIWYLHVSWIWDGAVVIRDVTRKPESVEILRTGKPVVFSSAESNLSFQLPLGDVSGLGEVIKLEWK
ncbi:MAG: alpha-L-fucosidase [Victivallales bacterium]|nr:alpha-L-fucosidase [Victivallales bacterium]